MSTLTFNKVNATNLITSGGSVSNLNTTNTTMTNLTTISTSSAINLTVTGTISCNQPYCIVFAGTTQSIPNLTNTLLDTYWSGSSTYNGISQSTGVFTVTYAGTYLVVYNAGFSGNVTGIRAFWSTKNNSVATDERYGASTSQTVTSGDRFITTNSFIIQLAAGDNVRVMAYQNSGVPLNGETAVGERFTMIKLF